MPQKVGGRDVPLRVTGDQSSGLAGDSAPGATIEALNLTTAPEGRLHLDDTMEIARADASGHFRGKLPNLREGDQVRVRARLPDGTTSPWIVVRAAGRGPSDSRNAVVALHRIGLSEAGSNRVSVTNINEGRPVSEPGAKLQFTNTRTRKESQVTLDSEGSFPRGFEIEAQPGDVISVAASDGVNDPNFQIELGRLCVPGGRASGVDLVPDPPPHNDDCSSSGQPRYGKATFTGPLYRGDPEPTDVHQGQLNDCYFAAAMGALAHATPDVVRKLITANGDGTYTVLFKEKDPVTNGFRDVPVKVDGDLWVIPRGAPLYGSDNGPARDSGSMPLWFALAEKAFAQWNGSYKAIGDGGLACEVFEKVLGKNGTAEELSLLGAEALWTKITQSLESHRPMAFATFPGLDENEVSYTGTGLYADHCYSILGTEEKGGERYLRLRNPWGQSEPGYDGKNDGIFLMKLGDAMRLFFLFFSIDS